MRQFTGKAKWVVWGLAAAFTVYQLYTEGTAPFPPFAHRSIHLAFGMTLAFLLYPAVKNSQRKRDLVIDLFLCGAVLVVMSRHIITGWNIIPPLEIADPSLRDTIFSIIFILLCFEVARRLVGWVLVMVVSIFVLYAFLGPFVPGILGHPGMDLKTFVIQNYMTELGTLGMAIDLSSGIIFGVVAFGGFMLILGGGDLIIKVATAIAGRFKGGPAKVAVIASAFFGTISGSAVANVAATGVFTIPMMKRLGYRKEFAGAVEACASTGGMIMPPVMGVSAFVMVQFLNIPYGKICIAALIPAIFYFATLFVQIHFEAVKTGLLAMPKEEIPRFRDIPLIDWLLLAPVGVFAYFVAVRMLSVELSAFYSIISVWISFIVHELVAKRRLGLKKLILALETPARQLMPILGSLVILGNVIYAVEITGLGTKLSMALIQMAGGNVILMLFLSMIASLVLGMGLPAIACYIFLAVLAAPALIHLGIPPLAAHMFVFYFGQISAITPPICVASFVAAGIAGADPMKVGLQGTKLGIAGYLIPYMFALTPSLLMNGTPAEIITSSALLIVAVVALAATVEGYFLRPVGVPMRIVGAAGAAMIVVPGLVNHLIGVALVAVLVVFQVLANRIPARQPDAAS